MTDVPNNILFWGVGSIGSLFGGLLKTHNDFNSKMYFLGREPHIQEIKKHGLKIYERSTLKLITPPIQGFSILPESFDAPFDAIFVTCKTRDNIVCASDLQTLSEKGYITSDTKLIIVQNGVGNEDHFLNIIAKENIYRVITTEGALVTGPGKVMHSGPGTTLIGKPLDKYGEYSELLAKWFTDVGLPSSATNHILMKTWDKVLINAPINPIATLYKVTNGELLTQPHLRKLVEEVVNETVRILRSRNLPFDEDVDHLESVLNVAKATALNKCSMLQDIEKGRHTEIDYLNGRLLYEATLAGIQAPLNKELTARIKELESKLLG